MDREAMEILTEWNNTSDEPFCFVVAGEIGAGKSTLVNSIANDFIAETRSGAESITDEVEIYDREIAVPQSGRADLKLKVQVADTPGLNDSKKSFVEIFREVSEKVPEPHALFYCFQINTRFRRSDQQLLSAMSKCYGIDIWKRVVIVLTHADVVSNPMNDMQSHERVIKKYLADEIKLDENIISKIPFRLAALEPDFIPPDYPQGEGQRCAYNWKVELIAAAVRVVPPEIVPIILKLNEKAIMTWFERHGYKMALGVSVLCIILAIGCGATAIAVPFATPIAAPIAILNVLTVKGAVGAAGAALGATCTGSGAYLVQVCNEKYKEYKKYRQVGGKKFK